LAFSWAAASRRAGPIGRARRLDVVRPLASFCAAIEPETEIPPVRVFGPSHRRVSPHIFTDDELGQLLAAASDLPPPKGLRSATMSCLLGLLAATGLRISEALHLRRSDVDLAQALVCVLQTKYRKSRYVPLHPTACEALATYVRKRDQRVPLPTDPAFFLLDDGHALDYQRALYAFRRLRAALGWDRRPGRRPRLYDLRHSFACRRLLGWYNDGTDVDVAMPLLATYLGHGKVTDTYWYLTAVPALMTVAAERFERLSQAAVAEATS
jgi:integrase